VPDSFVQRASNTFLGSGPALERLLRSLEPPTALMAATDVLGAGLIHAAVGLGLRVPDGWRAEGGVHGGL
jgi:DNA-binding LacI/PurR family transcriptional regulator